MNVHRFDSFLFGLLTVAAAGGMAGPIRLRHVNVVALQLLHAGVHGPFRIEGIRHGYSAYQDGLDCRLIDDNGMVTRRAGAPPGGSVRIDLPRDASGRLALVVNSGWNLAMLHPPTGLAWALRADARGPLRTVREWGPLYFHVPSGTKRFRIWVQASVTREAAHVIVTRPDGKTAVDREDDFDRRTRLDIEVSPGQGGKPWSIVLVRCGTKGFVTDDVTVELGKDLPGFLAPVSDWAALFAAGERRRGRTPERAMPSKLPASKPMRTPYRPPDGGALAWAYARRAGAQWRTSLPVTYVLDYGSKHVGNASYVPTVATAPPTLLHLGKDVPFNHAWGPIHALGGENQAYGTGDYITHLSPAEVEERMASLTAMVHRLHKTGVRFVAPYICGMTLNGDYDKRTGFWEFYDHWNEYRALGLGPRPQTDPRQWLQTTPDGKPRIYYGYDMTKGYYPPFKTNHRFAACWHTSGWRTWLLEVVRFIAKCGCDGVFVDNANSQRSRSPAALTAFRKYLRGKYTTDRLRALLGVEDVSRLSFPDPKTHTPLSVELQRFWCKTVHDELAAIKRIGTEELGREFIVFPNGGRPAYIQDALEDTDFVMFEKSRGDYGTHPGLVFCPLLGDLKMRVINDNIFEYTFVRSLRERVRPVILSRPGYPHSKPWLRLNLDAARLGMAECAAFSGGGGFLLRPRFDIYRDALNEYREFFEKHPDLYAGLLPYASTALLALPEQEWFGNPRHLAAVRRITPRLADAHVPFEFLSRRRFEALRFPQSRTVAALDARVLSDRQLAVLARFVNSGGTLVVTGAFGDVDEYLRPRPSLPAPFAAISHTRPGRKTTVGPGTMIRTTTDAALVKALSAETVGVSRDDGNPTDGVRLNLYRTPDGNRVVLHIVNYNVPLGTAPAPVESVHGLHFRFPLPPKRRIVSARLLIPGTPSPIALDVTEKNDAVVLPIPAVRIYAVVDIRLTDDPGA